MRDITDRFQITYQPVKALLIYRPASGQHSAYIEAFDIDPASGKPINAHPLTDAELDSLQKALKKEGRAKKTPKRFLQCGGLLPECVLFIDNTFPGCLMWYTPGQTRHLYFKECLTIASGEYPVPGLLWCASATHLRVFALGDNQRPTGKTPLQYAPFFNVWADGRVCMGTASIHLKQTVSIPEFIAGWEDAFFNSYFSHLNGQYNPVSGNIIQLWQSLLASNDPFPAGRLRPASRTLDQLITGQSQP